MERATGIGRIDALKKYAVFSLFRLKTAKKRLKKICTPKLPPKVLYRIIPKKAPAVKQGLSF